MGKKQKKDKCGLMIKTELQNNRSYIIKTQTEVTRPCQLAYKAEQKYVSSTVWMFWPPELSMSGIHVLANRPWSNVPSMSQIMSDEGK